MDGNDFPPVILTNAGIHRQAQWPADFDVAVSVIDLRLDINQSHIRCGEGNEGVACLGIRKIDGDNPGIDILPVSVGYQVESIVHTLVFAGNILIPVGVIIGNK